jgi:hypothetical protein
LTVSRAVDASLQRVDIAMGLLMRLRLPDLYS